MKLNPIRFWVFLVLTLAMTAAARADSTINTMAGDGTKAVIGQPFGVEIGPRGGLYICEVANHRIQRLDFKTNKLTVVAGSGHRGYEGDGGQATKAKLFEPYEVRFDQHGNMFFVEMKNHIVRKVDAKTGVISTVAGTGKAGYSGDGGAAIKASMKQPHSIALDTKKDQLYIADIGNNRIRRVNLKTGVIETVIGNGKMTKPNEGKVSAKQPIASPRALFVQGRTLWVALRSGHSIWRMNLDTKILSHVAGSGKKGNKDGAGKVATFNGPKGIAVGPGGFVFVVDTENQTIRKIDPNTRLVTTVAGIGPKARGFGGDRGPATKAKMDRPHGICVDAEGRLFIGDTNNHRVRVVE